jgi:hypothetical protein
MLIARRRLGNASPKPVAFEHWPNRTLIKTREASEECMGWRIAI